MNNTTKMIGYLESAGIGFYATYSVAVLRHMICMGINPVDADVNKDTIVFVKGNIKKTAKSPTNLGKLSADMFYESMLSKPEALEAFKEAVNSLSKGQFKIRKIVDEHDQFAITNIYFYRLFSNGEMGLLREFYGDFIKQFSLRVEADATRNGLGVDSPTNNDENLLLKNKTDKTEEFLKKDDFEWLKKNKEAYNGTRENQKDSEIRGFSVNDIDIPSVAQFVTQRYDVNIDEDKLKELTKKYKNNLYSSIKCSNPPDQVDFSEYRNTAVKITFNHIDKPTVRYFTYGYIDKDGILYIFCDESFSFITDVDIEILPMSKKKLMKILGIKKSK